MSNRKDTIRWMLTSDGIFTIKSFLQTSCYCVLLAWLTSDDTVASNRNVCGKYKLLLKLECFLAEGWLGKQMFCPLWHVRFFFFVAKLVWSLFKCAFDLRNLPGSLITCFRVWNISISKINKNLAFVGVSAFFWTIWRCMNNITSRK